MLSPAQTNQPIKMLVTIFAISLMTNLYAAVTSTVLPYIQGSQMVINQQVTAGMEIAKNRIDGINELTKSNLKVGYEKKASALKGIKLLNAQTTLLTKEIDQEQIRCTDFYSVKNKISAASIEAGLVTSEKSAVSNSTESF